MTLEERKEFEKLKERVKTLEHWIATHPCKSLPPNIELVIGKPLPKEGEPFIPNVEG